MLRDTPTVSIVCFVDCEKDPQLLNTTLKALWDWNRDEVEQSQIVLVKQGNHNQGVHELCASLPYVVDVVCPRYAMVNNYPIWDIFAVMRQLRPWLVGEYVMLVHPEHLWYPGTLMRSIETLRREKPDIAIGNLRRLGDRGHVKDWQFDDCCGPKYTQQIMHGIAQGTGESTLQDIPTWTWCYWLTKEPYTGWGYGWSEDVYFVRQAWNDAADFWNHGGVQLFQDIHDVFTKVNEFLTAREMQPSIYRMTLEEHKIAHLYHTKTWNAFTPEIRQWCFDHAELLKGTSFLDAGLWDKLQWEKAHCWYTRQPIMDLRRGPGGTVTRYMEDFEHWYDRHYGAKHLRQYNQSRPHQPVINPKATTC